jgi:hypothetical protein
VLIQDGGINHLVDYFRSYPNCKHLVQGPLLYDDLQNISTHFDPIWRGDMYGIWATDTKSYITGEPFEIPMQGMGLLAFEKSAWKGINQNFKGFGGEEGYIAEKFRQWGGKNICLPKLKWNHRFGRPNGVQYPLILEDRILNDLIEKLDKIFKKLNINNHLIKLKEEILEKDIRIEKTADYFEKWQQEKTKLTKELKQVNFSTVEQIFSFKDKFK